MRGVDKPEFLKLLLERGLKVDTAHVAEALKYGSFECFKLLHEYGGHPPSFFKDGENEWHPKCFGASTFDNNMRDYLIANGYLDEYPLK
jgi:hypothetical protein